MKLSILRHSVLAILVGAGLGGGLVSAAPIPVKEASFEENLIDDGTAAGSMSSTNWSASGNAGRGLMNPTDEMFPGTTTASGGQLPAPAEGAQYAFINCAIPGYCWQDVGVLQPNTIYTLTVAVGQRLDRSPGAGIIALVNGINPFGTILASTPVDSSTIPPGTFADSTVTFTTGQQASGHFTILLQGDSGDQIGFDNVRLDATPAPQMPTALLPTASPTNVVYAGTLVTLSEDPAGAAPFHYQWQSDNGSGGTFSDLPGANSSSFVVNTTSYAAGAPVQFRVVVTNSFGGATSAAVTVTALTGPPVIAADTLPVTGSDVLGSQATLTAAFVGSLPIAYQWQRDGVDLAGATNTTLTLTNLQYSDNGSYSLRASNALGMAWSTARFFTVNPVPEPEEGVTIAVATQTGNGGATTFSPTWTIATNSLIAGLAPSSVGTGNFSADGSGLVGVLTDGKYGRLNPAGNGSTDFVTCGVDTGGGGASVTYSLPASATGYDITNLVVYGGWSDAGRDQQKYAVYYSTVASPTVFNPITSVDYNPTLPGTVQSATRVTLTAPSGALARNVAAIKIDFDLRSPPAVENGYAGYCEIGVFGAPSAPAPVVASNTSPVSGSDVVGSEVTFTAAFSSATPMTYQWQVNKGSGPVDIPGATGTTLALKNLQLSDSGTYSLRAANASGTVSSSPSVFTVNPAPQPDGNGIVVSPANQTGGGGTPFTPTWTLPAGSLIAGQPPSSVGAGNFSREGAGGVAVLTDGQVGPVGGGNNTALATCGNNLGGRSVTYTLAAGASSGYDLTNLVVWAGWGDRGRDQQAFTVYYSSVIDPNSFFPLTSVDYNPAVGASAPSMDRVSITSQAGGPLALNVARVRLDFAEPAGENGYSGYSEIAVFGSPSAPVAFAPVVTADTLPVTGSDVEGSQVTFTAAFGGSAPMTYQWQVDTGAGFVDIPGATTPTLMLNNLKLGDTGSYRLQASNAQGMNWSTARSFTVNPAPTPLNGLVTALATQTGNGGAGNEFVPTWTLAPDSLIAGVAPSSVGAGNFTMESAGGLGVLTDGKMLVRGSDAQTGMATCGSGNGPGKSVIYTLGSAASGYDLRRIVVYGGWADGGRDQQAYTLSYATVENPANFLPLTSVNFNPSAPSGQSATRATTTAASAGVLAANVVAVKFDFTTPAGENGYSGYAEIAVFGSASAPLTPPTVYPAKVADGKLILTGAGGQPGGSYTWLTSTDVAAPLANWTTHSTGVFNGSGAFSNAIPVNSSEPLRFYRLKTP